MKTNDLILAADVGGTKTLISLFSENNCELTAIKTSKYASHEFDSLEVIIQDFLEEYEQVPKVASFGIPGPVENGIVKSTNLPWIIDRKLMMKHTGISEIILMNDLEATAYILPRLASDEVINIKKGIKKETPERYVVIAPGTGLGQSFLIQKDGKSIVIPSEGGHANFAPSNEIEFDLYNYVLKKFGHVSYERIISGTGIPNIFDFLVKIKKQKPNKETLEKMKTIDRAVVISEMALKKSDKVCELTLELFVSILGAHAGDLALTFLPDGGIYLAGGIPFKILPKLLDGNFVTNFLNKGRMKTLIDHIPINVITNNMAAIKGAAYVAHESCQISKNKKY
jgi:glucokinase